MKHWMWVALFVCGLSLGSPASSQTIALVTLGDSLTAGDGDEPFQGGYPQRLFDRLAAGDPDSRLNNLGISGNTTEDLVALQLDAAVSWLNGLPAGDRKLALVWIGSNDLFGLYNSDLCDEWYGGDLDRCETVEIADSLDRVDTILSTLAATGADLYIACLDDQSRRPVVTDPSLRAEYLPGITDDEVPRMSDQIQRYNDGVRARAATRSATVVDFYHTTLFETPSLLSDDGNHPNGAGYDQVAEIWYQAVTGGGSGESCTADSTRTPDDPDAVSCPSPGDDGGNVASASGRLMPEDFRDPVTSQAQEAGSCTADSTWTPDDPDAVSCPSPGDDGGNVASASGRLMPEDFHYLGAFRLPGDEDRPRTFAYGGNAMTFNPAGDAEGPDDGFPGSLYLSGHDRMAYGELPDGDQIAEISIPVPRISDRLEDLNTASFLQEFQDVFAGWFTHLEEIPRIAMQYLDHPATGPKIHGAWGAHYQSDPPAPRDTSQVWFDPDLTDPRMQGAWYLDDIDPYRLTGYLLEIPAEWADTHAQGRYLGAGRFRDGGWGGMGPNLIAYTPWLDEAGTPPAAGATLEATRLLFYASSQETEDVTEHSLDGYQHPDEWEGGAWITTSTGKSALLFVGTKGIGEKFWYGYRNPAGPEYPCVQEGFLGTVCYLANGDACPPEDREPCCTEGIDCLGERGWWSSAFTARILLYDPDDLAQVAAGNREPWEPQPYAHLDIDDHLFLNPAGIEEALLGVGVQRRFRLGDVAYDRARDRLYVLEWFADEAKPVVHVWQVR